MRLPLRHRTTARIGCGYLLGLGLLMCVLFVVNLMFVKAFIQANFPNIDFRFSQAAYSVMPVVLIFLEFWIFDLIVSGHYRREE